MTGYKKSDCKPLSELLESFSDDERQGIVAGTRAILENTRLAEVRKALDVTQNTLSARTGIKQAELSRIENNIENVQIKTLDRYVSGLGGTCKIVAEFPDGVIAEIPLRAVKPVKSKVKIASRGKSEADLDIAS
jgi:DNA-binding Xre family transcriptional regulator